MNPTNARSPIRAGAHLVAALALLAPAETRAGCAVCSCSASAGNLSFGTYNPTSSTPTRTNANITVNCFSVLVLMFGTVDIGLSTGTSGSAATRTLANGTSRLNYNVYQENALATVWGGLGSGGQLETLSINGLLTYNTSRAAYGSIPARQFVKAGTYTDTITVTITF